MRKVCVVITARPSYSRIKSALLAMQKHPDIDLQIIVGASGLLEKYGRIVDVIRSDGFEVAAEVHMVIEGNSPIIDTKTTGLGIMEISSVLGNLKPDAVVTVADRFETMATAVASSFMGIPLIHIQGGEITGSIDEKVRHAITKLSDIHLTASENARQRVINMGENPERVFFTGCPSIDLVLNVVDGQKKNNSHKKLENAIARGIGVGKSIDLSGPFIVALQHPVTYEWQEAQQQIMETILAINKVGVDCFMFWPNVDAGSEKLSKGIRTFRERFPQNNFRFIRNLAPEFFIQLLYRSECLVGNSSAGIREASFLGLPVVNVGSRQAGRDRGKNVVDVGYDQSEISSAINLALSTKRFERDTLYGEGVSGTRIAERIANIKLSTEKKLHSSI